MTNLKSLLTKNKEALEKDISLYEEKLKTLPAGSLLSKTYVKKSSGAKRYNYYQYIDSKNVSYIKTSNKDLANLLAVKKLLQIKLKEAVSELNSINSYLDKTETITVEQFLESNPSFMRILKQSDITQIKGLNSNINNSELLCDYSWRNKIACNYEAFRLFNEHLSMNENKEYCWNYEGGTTAPDQEKRNVNTGFGLWVRSKSEALIASRLYYLGFIFLYEPQITINGRQYYPDFYIFHPVTGEIIIIEHAGMLCDTEQKEKYSEEELKISVNYTRKFAEKIKTYINGGLLPGINLFITSETLFKPFDAMTLESIITQILGYAP